jgi:hypothetical protein
MPDRPYRLIFNNDGGTLFRPFSPASDVPFTTEGFLDATLGYLENTHVDAFSWTLGTDVWPMPDIQGAGRATNFYCHKTDVGERFYELNGPFHARSWKVMAERVKTMIENGDDPPRLLAEAAHQRGLDFFLSVRMNDAHDGRIVERNRGSLFGSKTPLSYPVFENGKFNERNIRGHICRMKLDHPDWLIGDHDSLTRLCAIAFDYAHQPVRDFRLALIEEALEQYDIEGIELDFLRHPLVFKPGEERTHAHLMTEFIGRVRNALDRTGKERGKHLCLSVRTLIPLEAARRIGLDVDEWLQEAYIDQWIGGIVDRSRLELREAVNLAARHNCPVYASFKTDAILGRGHHSTEAFRAIAANHYRAGVQGIYVFNMTAYRYRWLTGQTPPEGLGINYDYRPLRKIGSFDDIRHGNKHYIFDNKGSGHRTNVTTFAEWSSEIQDRLLISEWGTALDKPVLPTHLQQGESVETVLRIADDPTEAEEAGLQMRVTLRLILADITGGSHILNVSLNDTALPEQRLKGQSHAHLDLAVPNSSVKCGDNTLELSLASEDPNVLSEIRIDDVEVFISYG